MARRRIGRARSQEEFAEKRDYLLDAATKIFARRGYRSTDVQEVADRTDVGKGTIYRYFGDKKGLFLAAVDRGVVRLRDAVLDAVTESDDLEEKLRRGAKAYLEFFDKNRDLVEIFIQERSEFRGSTKSTYFVHRDGNIAVLEEILKKGMEKKIFRKMDLKVSAEMLADLLFGTVVSAAMRGKRRPLAARAEEMHELVMNGIMRK